MKERFDVNYWLGLSLYEQLYARPRFPLTPLRQLVTLVQYGISERATVEQVGTPILRMNNLQADGWDLTDLKYVELDEQTKKSFLLKPGDLLFNRTNSKELVGKCDVFQEPGEWVFASYLIRVQLDEKKALPVFVSDFLNTRAGRVQIDRVSRQIIGMSNVNAEELQNLLIPFPPTIEIQQAFIAEMNTAREARWRKLAQANELLRSLDSWLLEHLGLTPPQANKRNVFAIQLRAALKTSRLNADYFHPERVLTIRAMEKQSGHLESEPLSAVVDFIRDARKTPEGKYLGLANVQSHTGELVEANEEAEGGCLAFGENDVLFARLRPYLNKVYRAEFPGVCSPEFHVLRIKNSKKLKPDYLGTILRSSLILAQTRHMMTGNTHPRLTNEDVVNLVVPIPEPEDQEAIAVKVQERRQQARRLRAEAETEWQAAKERFEQQLLSGSGP